MTGKKKEINSIIVDAALKIMLAISVCMVGLLAFYSVTGTFYPRGFKGLESFLAGDGVIKNLIVFGFFCLVILSGYRLFEGKVSKKERVAGIVLAAASVILFAAGVFYLKNHPYYMDGDQINTFYGAVYATMEDSDIRYLMFKPGGYLGIYPQQKGLVVFYMILYKMFGERTFVCVQYLHLVYPQMILFSGYHILKTEKASALARIIFCIFIASCVPLYLYLPYMYGDLGSIAFSFLSVLFLVRFEKEGRIRDAVLLCISCTVALLLRKQIWIFIVAVMIVLVLAAVKRKKIRYAVVALCVVIAARGTFFCIEKYFESVSGYRGVKGVPSLCWVVMGLQETDGIPGDYNRYNQGTFEENGFDADLANAVAKEDLKELVHTFAGNPAYARYFFSTKLRMEWTAPDFEALRITSIWKAESGRDPENPPGWLYSLYTGIRYAQMMGFANAYQTVIYLCAALLALRLLFKKGGNYPVSVQLSFIYVIGGILFFAFWENKCRYVFPFFENIILLVPYFSEEIGLFPLFLPQKKGKFKV